MKKRLEVGQIVNTFGIKGFVKVYPYVNDILRFDNLKNVYVKSKTVEQAEALRNSYLEIDRSQAIPLEKDEYFIADLLGLDVYLDTGEKLGVLDDIYNTGGSDIYVVKNEIGRQFLLPYIDDVVKNIDLENGKITVHLLDGLI